MFPFGKRRHGSYWIRRHNQTIVAYWDGLSWRGKGETDLYSDDRSIIRVIAPYCSPSDVMFWVRETPIFLGGMLLWAFFALYVPFSVVYTTYNLWRHFMSQLST